MVYLQNLFVTLFLIVSTVVDVVAFQPSSTTIGSRPTIQQQHATTSLYSSNTNDQFDISKTLASIALSTLIGTSTIFGGNHILPAQASDVAAQISLDRIPPTSISIQIDDLPVIGSILSGTYTKVNDGSIKDPSITIKSPKDKVRAISSIATGGHLEFDVGGKVSTHLDVDIAADEAGTAKVIVKSNLIPKLPFKNLASSNTVTGTKSTTGGKESQWNIVTNLGNGESYYYNAKSGVTQYDRPDKL
jgi:hypothetical protein